MTWPQQVAKSKRATQKEGFPTAWLLDDTGKRAIQTRERLLQAVKR